MPETFRFSPRPNRAHEIAWRSWSAHAFAEAEGRDRPILLNLTAIWCAACQHMDETTYSDPELIRILNEGTIPIRVDADLLPHVMERYIAGGWPTTAFLSPTGEVLWSATTVDTAELSGVAQAVLSAWDTKRDELRGEIERRRRALESARARHPISGLVRREAADDVLAATQDAFDPRNGGFGTEPKFPAADAIEPLWSEGWRTGNDDFTGMAERTLDGILAGELRDEDGGFFRYARAADWTDPQREKVLETNAGLLRAMALGARVRGRQDLGITAEGIVEWANGALRRPDGLWAASQVAADEYFSAPLTVRAVFETPPTDPVLYTASNAQWIRSLAEAGAALGRDVWIADAVATLDTLMERMSRPDGLFHHARQPDGEIVGPLLLIDSLEVAAACITIAQAAGSARHLAHAERLARTLQQELWAEPGGFKDHLQHGKPLGALRYADRPFELNAQAARLFLDLSLATGDRGCRAIAERILAVLSPKAGRYAFSAMLFAQTVEEFFDPPVRVFLVGAAEATADLRRAALRLPVPSRRVWTLEDGGSVGTHRFPAESAPAAFVCGMQSCSPPLRSPEELDAALAAVR